MENLPKGPAVRRGLGFTCRYFSLPWKLLPPSSVSHFIYLSSIVAVQLLLVFLDASADVRPRELGSVSRLLMRCFIFQSCGMIYSGMICISLFYYVREEQNPSSFCSWGFTVEQKEHAVFLTLLLHPYQSARWCQPVPRAPMPPLTSLITHPFSFFPSQGLSLITHQPSSGEVGS